MRYLLTLLIITLTAPAWGANCGTALVKVFGHEGGYVNDPHDPGGETKFGICKRVYPKEDIKRLTLERAAQLYRRDYWNPLHLGELKSQAIATEILDTAVNCGVGTAAIIVEKTVNALNGNGIDYPLNARIDSGMVAWINKYTIRQINRSTFWKVLNVYQGERYLAIAAAKPSMARYLNSWFQRVGG